MKWIWTNHLISLINVQNSGQKLPHRSHMFKWGMCTKVSNQMTPWSLLHFEMHSHSIRPAASPQVNGSVIASAGVWEGRSERSRGEEREKALKAWVLSELRAALSILSRTHGKLWDSGKGKLAGRQFCGGKSYRGSAWYLGNSVFTMIPISQILIASFAKFCQPTIYFPPKDISYFWVIIKLWSILEKLFSWWGNVCPADVWSSGHTARVLWILSAPFPRTAFNCHYLIWYM